jgi:hypothetical protein
MIYRSLDLQTSHLSIFATTKQASSQGRATAGSKERDETHRHTVAYGKCEPDALYQTSLKLLSSYNLFFMIIIRTVMKILIKSIILMFML